MKRCNVGGQAVMEGIMMKGPSSYALAVRKPDKEIALTVNPYVSLTERKKGLNIPIVRGVLNFVESLYIGTKTLMESAEYFEEEEPEESEADRNVAKGEVSSNTENDTVLDQSVQVEETANRTEKSDLQQNSNDSRIEESSVSGKKENNTSNAETEANGSNGSGKDNTESEKKEKSAGDKAFLVGTLCFSLVLAIGIFVLLPSFLANFLYKVTDSHFLVNLAEGVLRLIIFLVYIWAISKMEEIHRTFMYHGAEHKTINCLEAGDDLTPENVLKHTRFHKRCGTSFIFIVMFISILVFMFIKTDVMWLRLLSRILLIPVISGVSYEFIRYAGRHENAFANVLSKPGLWVQRLTTKEPTIDMAEVAIKSVTAVIDVDEYLRCVRGNCFEK